MFRIVLSRHLNTTRYASTSADASVVPFFILIVTSNVALLRLSRINTDWWTYGRVIGSLWSICRSICLRPRLRLPTSRAAISVPFSSTLQWISFRALTIRLKLTHLIHSINNLILLKNIEGLRCFWISFYPRLKRGCRVCVNGLNLMRFLVWNLTWKDLPVDL